MEPTLAEIRMFGGNFAPRGWAFCEGQLLPINANQALFSILGTTYGGDGRTTFALPDLRGRGSMQQGNGPGLSDYNLGQKGGREEFTLTTTTMPSHTHNTAGKQMVASTPANSSDPTGNVPAAMAGRNSTTGTQIQVTGTTTSSNAATAADSVEVTMLNNGGNLPFNILNPFLGVNFIIALQGLFPSRG